jgi:hypothetical protein
VRTAAAAIAIGLVAATGSAAPPVTRPPAERRWAIYGGGGLALAAPAFSTSSTFDEFAEHGSIETRNTPGNGPQIEAGLWRAVSRKLGVALTVARNRRDAPGTFSAAFPHPLYLDRHRAADGALPAGTQTETGVHFGLVWSETLGGITARFTGGPSYMMAEADLVEQVAHTDEYPFDAVQVTGVRASPVRGDALGGHAGLTLEHRLAGRIALGAGVRWERATISLARSAVPAEGTAEGSARLQAGGVTAAASLRLYF